MHKQSQKWSGVQYLLNKYFVECVCFFSTTFHSFSVAKNVQGCRKEQNDLLETNKNYSKSFLAKTCICTRKKINGVKEECKNIARLNGSQLGNSLKK